MNRRTLLKAVTAALVARPAAGLARARQTPAFTARDLQTLEAIAEVVLPSDLGAGRRRTVVNAFIAWFAGYRQGADMGHGYGASALRAPAGPSPALRYPPQFEALETAARDRGARTFAALPLADRRAVVEAILNGPPPVTRLPAQPTGASLIADFMGSYFTSADAWDRCYRAEIRRESCRTLDDSSQPPRPLR